MLYLSMLMTRAADRVRNEKGAALAEYGLLVALIAVVCVVAIGVLGQQINAAFTAITAALPAPN